MTNKNLWWLVFGGAVMVLLALCFAEGYEQGFNNGVGAARTLCEGAGGSLEDFVSYGLVGRGFINFSTLNSSNMVLNNGKGGNDG